jgi:hypothetical protein
MHYGFFKKLYAEKARLLMTDTDSLVYHIKTPDPIHDMLSSTEFSFDLVNALPKPELERIMEKHPELAEGLEERLRAAKGMLGALKLENGSKFIASYVGLAAKMYSMLMIDGHGEDESIKKGKGVPARVLKKHATHDSYRKVLLEPAPSEATFRAFRSFNHKLAQVEVNKRMLTAFNDKVFQLDALESRALGHWKNDQLAVSASSSSCSAAVSYDCMLGSASSR